MKKMFLQDWHIIVKQLSNETEMSVGQIDLIVQEDKGDFNKWKGHVVLLWLWSYNYDWQSGKWTNHHKRLLLRFADKIAVQIGYKKVWGLSNGVLLQYENAPVHKAQQAGQRRGQCGFNFILFFYSLIWKNHLKSSISMILWTLLKLFRTSQWPILGPFTRKDFWPL